MSKTSEYLCKEAQKHFVNDYNIKTNNSNYSISINIINQILDFPVKCIFSASRTENEDNINYSLIISLYSINIFISETNKYYKLFEYEKKLYKLTSEIINKFLLEFKNEILSNLQVDKLNGEFEIIDVINIKNLGIDIFSLDNCVSNECMVCLENTHTLTYCNHSLCIGCWNKLDNKSCPMCKTNLFIKK